MIKNKNDYKFYLEADRISLSKPRKESLSLGSKINCFFFPDYIWEFQKTLRKLEYYKNKNKNILDSINYFFVRKKYDGLSHKLGFTIPVNVAGPGLSIAHYGTIIINPRVVIGNNCRIHAGVNIGAQAGFADKVPTLGNNIYIGPGAKIFGDIKISNNTIIGANAVVNKSVVSENTSIGGIPAKTLSENIVIDDVLIRATDIIRSGLNTTELAGKSANEIKKLISGY
jgi:serine O-acetyltransferase